MVLLNRKGRELVEALIELPPVLAEMEADALDCPLAIRELGSAALLLAARARELQEALDGSTTAQHRAPQGASGRARHSREFKPSFRQSLAGAACAST